MKKSFIAAATMLLLIASCQSHEGHHHENDGHDHSNGYKHGEEPGAATGTDSSQETFNADSTILPKDSSMHH